MYSFEQILNAIQNDKVTDSIEEQMRKEIQEAEQMLIVKSLSK